MSAHTPGPWRIERGAGHAATRIVGADHVHTNGRARNSIGISSASYTDTVCEFTSDIDLPGPGANARLIAAAPDLLAALRELVRLDHRDTPVYADWKRDWIAAIAAANVALAKAEGK